ncbi:hypothetical protein BH24ACT10_BH24ACT10_12660 [soil metagenome]
MDGPAQTDGAVVYRLIYPSRNRIPHDDRRRELGELFSAARSHNKKNGITGALLLSNESFVQTLEGEQHVVQELLGRIRADTRHDQLEILDTGLVDDRVFARWAMAKVADDEDASDMALIAHTDGIAKAAPREAATADQEGVLTVMRDAARGRLHA